MGIIKYSIKDILKDAKKYNNRRDWKKKVLAHMKQQDQEEEIF